MCVLISPIWFAFLMDTLDWLIWAGDMFTEEQNELIESAAEMLYGLIHVRYILTSKGMAAMVRFFSSLSI